MNRTIGNEQKVFSKTGCYKFEIMLVVLFILLLEKIEKSQVLGSRCRKNGIINMGNLELAEKFKYLERKAA